MASGAQALLRYLKQELLDQKSTVLTTSMTFCATANVALNEGYNIQLLDISRETLHPSFEDIILSVNNNPTIKIVIFVHLYGYYTDLSSLYEYLSAKNVLLIEDCAHCFEAVGTNYSRPGTNSDAAIFSFYATKNITSGEGGAVISNKFAVADCLSPYILHGMSKGAFDRHKTSSNLIYDVKNIGIKANMSDINASILIPQLERIQSIILNRQKVAALYRSHLDSEKVTIASLDTNSATEVHSNHLMPILVPSSKRDQLRDFLRSRNIGTAINFPSLFDLSSYKHLLKNFESQPLSIEVGRQLLSLPLYEMMSEDDVIFVSHAVNEFLE